MYQLIMLPQTKLNTPAMRRKFAMASKHRIMPRSFGRYSLAGHDFIAIESEVLPKLEVRYFVGPRALVEPAHLDAEEVGGLLDRQPSDPLFLAASAGP